MAEAMKILIVEDEVIVAMEMQSQLASLGYETVEIVDTGEAAIQKSESLLPDAILMDIKLADRMDGIEAAAAIRRRFNVPIVFLTAHSEQQILQRAKFSEPYCYLVKPFGGAALRTTLEAALHEHSRHRCDSPDICPDRRNQHVGASHP